MNRKNVLWVLIVLCVMLAGCEHSFNPDLNKLDTVYYVRIKPMQNGTVTVIPDSGIVGTEIKVLVNPAPGYKLEPDSLQTLIIGRDRDKVSAGLIRDYDLRFQMMEGGVIVNARFIPVGGSEYSVTVEDTRYGYLSAYPITGVLGAPINIEVLPNSGYALKEGSLTANGIPIAGPPYNFTLDNSHVGTSSVRDIRIRAEYEKKGSAELVEVARRTLSAGEYELAFSYYEAAYQADSSNTEAVIYSVLGKVAGIIKNPKVRTLLKETGMSRVPANINELMAFENTGPRGWVRKYYDYHNYPDTDPFTSSGEIILPTIGSPQGFPMGFLNYPIYQVMNSRRYGPDRELFDVLLFWNIIGNHTGGLNDFLDDSIKYIFTDAFSEAVKRTKQLDYSQTAVFNETLKTTFKLDSVYDSGASIGRAELEMMLGFLYVFKSALEYLASYDWEADFSVLKVTINYGDNINNVIKTVLDNTIKDRLNDSSDFSPLGKILPFRNRFLRVRNAGLMSAAKADFQTAADMLAPAFDACYGRFLPAAQIKYQWMQGPQGMFPLLKTAMNNGDKFYLPEIPRYKNLADAMNGKTNWVSAGEAENGVNLGKLFASGYLSIDKLVSTEKAGKAPVFYGFKTGGAGGTAITYDETNMAQYDSFGFEIAPNFKEVFVKVNGIDTSGSRWLFELFPDTEFTGTNGIQLYNLYQKR